MAERFYRTVQGLRETEEVTRLLCQACQLLEVIEWMPAGPIAEWWERHKEAYRQREAIEARRQAAMEEDERDLYRRLKEKYGDTP